MNAKHVPDTPLERLAVSVEDAATQLGIGRSTMFELIRNGRLSSIKVGKRRLIPTSELRAFLDRATAERPWTEASGQLASQAPQVGAQVYGSGRGVTR